MNFKQLISDVGGNVFLETAEVFLIQRFPDVENILFRVEIIDPSTVPVTRIDTWLAKLDENGNVMCVLQPRDFPIFKVLDFDLKSAMIFPEIEITDGKARVDAVLERIHEGDTLQVLHILPAKNPGKYCSFEETTKTK